MRAAAKSLGDSPKVKKRHQMGAATYEESRINKKKKKKQKMKMRMKRIKYCIHSSSSSSSSSSATSHSDYTTSEDELRGSPSAGESGIVFNTNLL